MALLIELGCNEGTGGPQDTSGNGNHFSVAGGEWGGVGSGYYAGGNSITSNSDLARFSLPWNSGLDGLRSNYTITHWMFRPSGNNEIWCTAWAQTDASDACFMGYAQQNTPIYATVWQDGSAGVASTQLQPSNAWTHIAYVYEAATTTGWIFINGVQSAVLTSSPSVRASTFEFSLCGNALWEGEHLKLIRLDQIRVYDEVRTQQQIQDDMNTEIGTGPGTSVSFTSEPSATNIDTDRVTANATAESDAP